MNKLTIFLILICTFSLNAQEEKSSKMGQTTLEELQMNVYKKDSTANAVVLYEHGNYYMDPANDFIFRTDYYFRIKIFNTNAFDKAIISKSVYKGRTIKDVKGITYNLTANNQYEQTHLLDKDIFTVKEDEQWTATRFTLPNIKEGSVIEYSYSVYNKYASIPNWYFQSDIPKIKSEFDAAALGNYKFNIRLTGFLKLDKDKPSIKNGCIYIPGIGDGSCVIYEYGMNDIPAFKEEEYMTSKYNFISHLTFDLKSYTAVNGEKTKYTTTWKAAEKKLKSNFLNGQTSKKSFFKKQLPSAILTIDSQLEKAKKTYQFIQNHYNWNDKYYNVEDVKIKKAFKEKSGGVDAINLSLYNSLQAADIESYVVLSSTRENGFPTKLYPVLNDFNYVLVKAVINNKDYFLDATDPFLSFGMLPLRSLNGDGRVLNFKEGGYWQAIASNQKSITTIKVQLALDTNNEFFGKMGITTKGYRASEKREKINTQKEDAYIEQLENKNADLLIDNYTNTNLTNFEKPLKESFDIELESDLENIESLRINPFIIGKIKENPFKLNERNYPVDFGYTRKYTYMFSFTVPESYTVTKIPENTATKLPNNGGLFLMNTTQKNQKVNVILKFNINKKIYSQEEYYYLKEFYKQLIEAENSYIKIVKKK